jgi:3-methylfumaryl-CoA hydratase
MSGEAVTTAEVESYRSYVGRTVEHADTVDRSVALRFAATLGVAMPDRDLPPLWHYGLFLPAVATAALDVDGHPRRGDFLPPVRLPRRMFAGSALRFVRPLTIGEPVSRVSRIAAVDHRHGRLGDLIFVKVAMTLQQADGLCIEEEQTIVYRKAGDKVAAIQETPRLPVAEGETDETWLPTTTELFRYSASTFNAHRIHYDLPYALGEEGYPGLVVHGPLIATRLCGFAARLAGRGLASFTFRGEAPCFVGQEIRLVGRVAKGTVSVRAERADGVTAMSATATV